MWRQASIVVALMLTIAPRPTSAQPFDAMKCVQVRDHTRFKATLDLTALDPAFGVEGGCKILGTRLLCTPVASTTTSSNVGQIAVEGEPLSTDKICYAVHCPRGRPLDRSATDQFGGHQLTARRTQLVCVPAGSVLCVPSGPETCDGIDNDCNGQVDDLGSVECGTGPCARTVPRCIDGVPHTCTPGAPQAEVCNGIDDDCNGSIDDGLGTTTCGVGDCEVTVEACIGGKPQECTPSEPGIEICDGRDNDCDGAIDEGLSGTTTCGLGACMAEADSCADGRAGTCVPGAPSTEICNTGIDENCNGLVDEQGCVCQPGTADCDVNASNGCEADLETDVDHCGSCEHACASGEVCAGGMCVSP